MKTEKPDHHILIVDDEPSVLETFMMILKDQYTVHTASNGEEALSILSTKTVDVIFLDIALPDINGLDLLQKMKQHDEHMAIIMATAIDSSRKAVQAMKLGAFNYITKPFDVDEILTLTEKACQQHDLHRELFICYNSRQKEGFTHIIGNSPAMKHLHDIIKKICNNDSTILITGESGTGKELVARAIHFHSNRAQKPFIPVNCASIPDTLLESELFGYEKGAFTGAFRSKLGMFELAHEGTLFLDEISSLKIDVQANLLRVLEEKEIKRLGGTKILNVNTRIISATNVHLEELIEENKFRKDLFYRLNVVPLHIPPLRQRKKDIPLLAQHFLNIFNQSFRKHIEHFTDKAMAYLIEYEWPGNVRELKNIVERIAALGDRGVITPEDLPFDIFIKHNLKQVAKCGGNLKEACRDFERQYIETTLNQSNRNQTQAAKKLGIHRNALFQKMKILGLKT